MKFGWIDILERNFQRVSTNRFVVDSPRFWRNEWHPRFKDLFTVEDFDDIVKAANNNLSFPLPDDQIEVIGGMFWNWFSGYRFTEIPAKNPQSPQMFLADFYFSLADVLDQISLESYHLEDNDFNVMTKRAEIGKKDTARLGTTEQINSDTNRMTNANITSKTSLENQHTATVENNLEETDQNTKNVGDVLLSPQDQGAAVTATNTKGQGVDGINISPAGSFANQKTISNTGDSIITGTGTSSAGTQSNNGVEQNNDIITGTEKSDRRYFDHIQDNNAEKSDKWTEQLDFNRGNRLQDWYDLKNGRLWWDLLSRLSRWILATDIATAERNYNECQYYE